MTTVRTRVRGSLAPEQVWERYAVPARWPGWAPHLTSVTASTERITVGTRGTVHALGVPAHFEVTAVDEQRRTWSWTVRFGPLVLHLAHDVTSYGVGCRTGLAVTGPAPVVLAYLPIARWALTRLVSD